MAKDKPGKGRLILRALIALLLILVGTYLMYNWWNMRLTEENLEQATRAALEYRGGALHANVFGDLERPACVPLPWNPRPDARSRSERAMSWHMDFLPGAPAPKGRQKQLQKLDALTAVGFLEKTRGKHPIDGALKEVIRYRMTDAGWRAASYVRPQYGRPPCFTYGKPRFLKIVSHERVRGGTKNPGVFMRVETRIGFGSADELEPWARDPRMQAAYREIALDLEGRRQFVTLARVWGGWIGDTEFRSRERRIDELGLFFELFGYRFSDGYRQHQERIKTQRAHPPPSEEEVRAILKDLLKVGVAKPWPHDCLRLPGDSRDVPVDEKLFRYRPGRYAVAIHVGRERTPDKRMVDRTIPYLETLERAGVLTRSVKRGAFEVGKGNDTDYFDVHAFKLAPAFRHIIDDDHPACVPLGEFGMEIVDLEILEDTHHGLPFSHFRYRLKLYFRDPPDWTQDASLRSAWPELDRALTRGKACQGQTEFDRETRTRSGGGSSCGWAFESRADGL